MFPAGADEIFRSLCITRGEKRAGCILIERHEGFAAIFETQHDDEFGVAIMRGGHFSPLDGRAAHVQFWGGSTKITSLGRMGLPPLTPPIAPEDRMNTCRFQL